MGYVHCNVCDASGRCEDCFVTGELKQGSELKHVPLHVSGRRVGSRAYGMLQGILHRLLPDRLSLRLVVASLFISSILTVFATAIQVYSSYERQRQDTLAIFDQVQLVIQRSLEQALWEFDFDQIETILDGLYSHQEIAFVSLVSSTGHQWQRGTPGQEPEQGVFALSPPKATAANNHAMRGDASALGSLTLHLSLDAVNKRVWAQFWTILISNVTKAYLGAMLLLVVVHRLIGRHLARIADHVSGARPRDAKSPLRLDRKPSETMDPLDHIVAAIGGYEARVAAYVDRLNQEIIEREAAQEAAAIASKARNQFLANMSRDIHMPMNSILGLFQLIKDGEEVPERHREQAQFGHDAAHKLADQLNNILDISRLDTNGITLHPEPCDLLELAQSWRNTALGKIKRRASGVQVLVDVDSTISGRYALDPQWLTRIIDNLTDNAVRHCEHGQISIRLRRVCQDERAEADAAGSHEGQLEIAVLDMGPSIRFEDRERIFERFTRIDDPSKRSLSGAGLGLALARGLASLMGATLKLEESEEPGFQNEFCLRFESGVERSE